MRTAVLVLVAGLVIGCRGRFDPERQDGGPPGQPAGITVGDGFSCVVRSDRTVWCWGDGRFGQLGDGSLQPRAAAGPVTDLASVVQIDAGLEHACAVLEGGSVMCWGHNQRGQIGDLGTLDQRIRPVAVKNLPGPATAVAAGGAHTCALIARDAWCWGENSHGEVGAQPSTAVMIPIKVLPDVDAIDAGQSHTCALRSDHSVWCWGINDHGQLGVGFPMPSYMPQRVPNVSAISLALGYRHSCAIVTGGSYTCWGANENGQLGDDTLSSPRSTPAAPSMLTGITQLTAGQAHTCGRLRDGTLVCWGLSSDGEIGNGSTNTMKLPIAAAPGTFAAVAAGRQHTCAVRDDGTVACWGAGSSGQIAGGILAVWTPTKVSLPVPGPASAIAAGGNHACALLGGKAYCWGDNHNGQLGANSREPAVPTPSAVKLSSGVELSGVAQITTGNNHTCAVSSGALYCWGDNSSGELGDDTTQGQRTPISVSSLTSVTAISAGDQYTCAISGKLPYCWGTDANGQLGDGTVSANQLTPLLVTGVTNATGISAGRYHVCVALTGTIMCWGSNVDGEIGNGRAKPIEKPFAISSPMIDEVSSGGLHTCGRGGATTYCWGGNNRGQVGDGSTADQHIPTVIGLPGDMLLESGYDHSCAVTSTGAYCWGDNSVGQLGDGTTTERWEPTLVPGFGSSARLAAGDDFTCALESGAVSCWGNNTRGQLGISTLSRSLTPIEVALP